MKVSYWKLMARKEGNINNRYLQLAAGLVCVTGEGMVGAKLLDGQFSFVETQPEILTDSRLC